MAEHRDPLVIGQTHGDDIPLALVMIDGRPDGIAIYEPGTEDYVILNGRDFIRDVATRLIEMSEQIPDPPRLLRRATDTEQHFADLEA